MSYHVYSLPPELLQTLTPRTLLNVPEPPRASSPEPEPVAAQHQSSSGPRTCNICPGVSFAGVDSQRVHFRSDCHRYNVKIRLNGGQPVSESAFAQLVDGLEDSISGSASSSSDNSESESDTVATLLQRQKLNARSSRSPSPSSNSRSIPRTAITWFHSPPQTQIGVYRVLFPLGTPESAYLDALKSMQSKYPNGRKWAMFMVAGGHFAGAVIRVSQPAEEVEVSVSSKKPKRPKPDTEILKHKTFHRYTTRRKQGGSQSLNDNAKGNAKSAGALLRRYGEQALRDDIRNLIEDWSDEINECELIFIRASGSNRKIFLDYDGSIISKKDDRLRTFPFPTRRPTQSELSRCLLELTKAKVSHLTEEALRAQDEAYLASLPKPKPPPSATPAPPPAQDKPKPVKLTKEEELLREKWSRLLEMVNKGRLEPLKAFWERESENLGGADVRIPDWTGERRTTLLQVAAFAGHEEVVEWLLEEQKADPTIVAPKFAAAVEEETDGAEDVADTNDGSSRRQVGHTAYELSKTRPVRDVFRRCAAVHPDWWDWFGAARVPSVLNREMEEKRDERDEKKKARRKGLKDKVKEREAKEKEKASQFVEEPPVSATLPVSKPSSGPQKLGGGSGDSGGLAGLTPEMRAKIERERRARAAEARLKGR
ncbi:hypothetical protein K435DRAFT_780677 [Dendrothele bispora CBS 962.96]|uniref:VLRF1 domain-containing protein n=1 Tax=Dendrothele bispora (strain CBS 962.96) TaxID=1314807 RepID=A0A4S8LQM3_DENBC|nr:hypothetical protein K435DRAFT_780677 [Dendrothele bispora CBS 962.96]